MALFCVCYPEIGFHIFDLRGLQTLSKAKAVQEEKEGVIAEVSEKPENSVNPETLSITHEQAWDFVEKYYTLDDVQALLGAVKERIDREGYNNLGNILTKALDKVA